MLALWTEPDYVTISFFGRTDLGQQPVRDSNRLNWLSAIYGLTLSSIQILPERSSKVSTRWSRVMPSPLSNGAGSIRAGVPRASWWDERAANALCLSCSTSYRWHAELRSSFHRSLILVQPIEDFLHHLVVGRDVSSLQDRVTLVFLWCPQETEHHILRCFQRKEPVISTIDQ
jgi:hypothetical protein